MLYDLHVHSTVSDGTLDRLSILYKANQLHMQYLSFTDHNVTVDNAELGIEYLERYNFHNNVALIDGIEVDCYYKKYKLHILIYGPFNFEGLYNEMLKVQEKNKVAIQQLLRNIYNEYGILIDDKELVRKDNKREIIQWLINHGYGNDPDIVADIYTSRYSRCYVPLHYLQFDKLVDIVKRNSNVIMLAHPIVLRKPMDEIVKIIIELKRHGLDGIEVLNLKHNPKGLVNRLMYIGQENNLLCSCGSDFHLSDDQFGINNDISDNLIRRLVR